MEVNLVAVSYLVHPSQQSRRQVRRIARVRLRPCIAGLSPARRVQADEMSAYFGLASLLSLGLGSGTFGGACLSLQRLTSSSNRSLRSLGPANAGPLTNR